MTDSPNLNSNSLVNTKEVNTYSIKELGAIDREFIKKYESIPSLWDTTHKDYNNKFIRNQGLKELLDICRKHEPHLTVYHVRTKINSLRSNYRKELKKYVASKRIGPDGSESFTYVPGSWKFYALRFLGGDAELSAMEQTKLEEINIDEVDFDNDNDNNDDSGEDLLSENDEKTRDSLSENQREKRRSTSSNFTRRLKKVKIEKYNDFFDLTDMSEMELKAVGANVVCKLKRMGSDQRGQAELLINKVLYHGLKNNLTSNTDLAEVEPDRSDRSRM